MPSLAAGRVVSILWPSDGQITITPGSAGRVSLNARGRDGSQSIAPREIYNAETINVSAGDTVILEAINNDATYTSPVSGEGAAIAAAVAAATPAQRSALASAIGPDDMRGTAGQIVYTAAGSYGLTFSTGGNAPALVEVINGKVWVTTPVTNWVDVTFPALPTTRLCPVTLSVTAESDDWSDVDSLIYYMAATGYSAFWFRGFNPATTGPTASTALNGPGARTFFSDRTPLTAGGTSPTFATTQLTTHKVRIYPLSGRSARVCVTQVAYDIEDVPSVSITFDDGYKSVFDNALPILRARGLKASWGIIADLIGTGGTAATLQNLRDWVAAGMECVTHGPIGADGNVTKHGTLAGAINDMIYNRQYLLNNDLADDVSANTYIWPQGVYFMGGNRREVTLRNAAAEAGFLGGRGTELPQFFNSRVAGAEMARWTVPIIGHSAAADSGAEAANISTISGYLDDLAETRKSGCLMFHYVGLGSGLSIDITTPNFTTLMNKIALLVSQGRIVNPLFSRQVAWGGVYY